MTEEQVDGVTVTRIPQFPDHSRSALRRALYYLSFAASASTIGAAVSRPTDLVFVYVSALPVAFAGWIVSLLRRVPLVYDIADLWPDSVTASGLMENRLLLRLLRGCCSFLYRRADAVNTVTKGFRRRLVEMGVPLERIEVVHNWMPSETYTPQLANPGLAEKLGMAGKFNVVYAGTMGPVQALSTVLEAAKQLLTSPPIQFVFVGSGLELPLLRDKARELRLTNVTFLERRPPEEMPGILALGDVLLVHLKPDPLSDISIPSKTFSYMACGKPILLAVRGEAAEFVAEHGFGLAVRPSDADALATGVRQLFEMSEPTRNAMGESASRVYQCRFSGAVQIKVVEQRLRTVSEVYSCRKRRSGLPVPETRA